MARKGDWITVTPNMDSMDLRCGRCGLTTAIDAHTTAAWVIGHIKEFLQKHKECRARAGGKP